MICILGQDFVILLALVLGTLVSAFFGVFVSICAKVVSFVFCSIVSEFSCSRMLVHKLRQSSQRLKPYLSSNIFFLILQISHFPFFVPIIRLSVAEAVCLLSYGSFVTPQPLWQTNGDYLS